PLGRGGRGPRGARGRRGGDDVVAASSRPVDQPAEASPYRNSPAPGTVQATLIHNPAAGPRSRAVDLEAVRTALSARGWVLRVEATAGPAAAMALAREAVERGDDAVIVAGGDGTINEVIQALAGTTVPLGVLPVGTVNVWAREIGLPARPVAAAKALADGAYRSVDLGRAGDRCLLLRAGSGC